MNPLILQKLQAFAVRRRRLIILRGICTALAMLLATMMAVALLDRLFQMPDWLRWVLSGVAYVAVLIAEWRACLRLLLHMPGPRRLARLVEETAPELREDLLSAVELGDGDARFDSPVFRELLQSSVAERVSTLDAQHLLPVQLLRRSFLILGGVLVVLIAAFFFSGLGFGTMLLRAMLPMANLERLSTIKVHILDPNPAEMVVPQGDSVPLDVQISGGKVEKAYLETYSKAGGRNVVQLSAHGQAGDRFAGGVQIAREDVDYRVRAGDGRSIWYRLHAAARPHVIAFHKTYTYPAYAELPPKTVEETSGDLVALEGSEVDLRIDTDQPVKTAELRTETGKSSLVVPLEKAADGALHAKLQLASSGLYHVHLVAAQSGFENKFSPEYELRAEPDLIPRVELELPEQDLIAANSQTIEFSGIATDDLAVSGVEQVYKVNDKPWKKIELPVTPGAKVRVRQLWDLSQEHLRAGDQVTAKLVASDRKGNRGESRPVQITLVESGFDPRRAEDLTEQTKLLQELIAMRNAAVTLVKRCDDARGLKDKGPAEEAKFAEAWRTVGEALDDYEAKEANVSAQLVKTLPKVEPGSEAGVLVMLGRRLARADSGAGWVRALHRSVLDPASEPVRGDFVHQAVDAAHRMENYARTIEEGCRKQVGTVELGVISENLQVLWRDQKQLAEQSARTRPEDAPAWFKLASHYRVVLAEAVQIEDALLVAAQHVPQRGDPFRQLVKRLQKARGELAKTIAAEHPDNKLQGPANNYAGLVADALNQLLDATRESVQHATNVYEQMRREVQPAYTYFERVRWEVEEPQRNERVPAAIRTYQSESRWDERAAMWKKYGDWEEVRPDADNYFVQELRQLSLALPRYREVATSLGKSKERDDVYKELTALAVNFRVLECVHDLTEIATGLDALAAQERWESASLRARTAGPTAWAWLDNRLRLSPEEIGHIEQRDPEVRKTVNEAQQILRRAHDEQDGRNVQQEMQQRMNKERRPIAQESPVRAVAAQVREAIRLLQPVKDKAAAALAAAAPKLPEKLAELAKEAAALKQKSEERAAAAQNESTDTAKAETKQELAQQQKLNAEVDAVKDAIRNDAQRQNLLDEQGRERARDADDALGMLREPPPRAAQALADSAAAEKAEERKDALQSAAAEQQKLASALDELAKHYDALEQGKPEETRMALREAEKALGLKPNLDRQFAQSEQLAKAAEGSPEEMLKQLEKALPQNPVMRQELSGVAKNVLQNASEKLAMATHEEQKIAKNVSDLAAEQAKQTPPPADAPKPGENTPAAQTPPQNTAANPPATPDAAPKNTPPADASAAKPDGAQPPPAAPPAPAAPPPNPMLAQAATQQPAIAQNAKQAGEEVERAGRHEERLKHQQNGEQLQRLGREVQGTADHEVPQAKEALEKAQAAAQAKAPVEQAGQKLDRDLNRLDAAANGAPEAAPAPAPADAAAQMAQNKPAAPDAAAKPDGAAPANAPAPAPGEAAKPDAAAMAANAASPPAPAPAPAPGATPAPGENGSPIPPAGATATPQQQVWMARALDSLDAALHAQNTPPQEGAQQGDPSAGQPKPGQGQSQAQQPGQAMADAKQAMNAAAQSAAAAMRAQRSEAATKQRAETAQGELAESLEGSDANGPMLPGGALPKAGLSRNGDWGKLPKQMAEQLSQGQREGVSSEYRNQVETYYRVIAERAKKP